MKQHEIAPYAILVSLLLSVAPALTRQATAQTQLSPCAPGQELITIPEIKSENGRLRAEITLTSGKRTLWGSAGDARCVPQDLRYFTGRNLLKPGPEDPAFAKGEPIPGPTLRARVGDLIQVRFLNQVDPQAFANSLDQGLTNPANTTGCDEVYRDQAGARNQLYPGTSGDVYPNCLHGSSTSNLHFHGTHTTPDTTGDNILLFVRPALRSGPDRKTIEPKKELVDDMFDKIFSACEKDGTPTKWAQLPDAWTKDQERLLKKYDATTPYQGKPGPLPKDMQLWPVNAKQILIDDVWPQYQIGAYPYCFRLADTAKGNSMGQAPGTHWYHAHKHGSTALNVANGMTGAFVIEGQYDDDLRKFYGPGFRDQVLVIQQLSSTPFPLLMNRPNFQGPNSIAKPQLSVNGRLNPVVKMRPGEVQLWRLVNGAFRDAVQLQNFAPHGGLAWRQIAQDGVQLRYENYSTTLGTVNRMINMAPANRVDLLVKAPVQPRQYTLIVLPNAGLPLDPSASPGPQCTPADKTGCVPLLTVSVEGQAVSKPQEFIQKESDFPTFPAYLADIPPVGDPKLRRTVTFGAGHNLIDGKSFNGSVYNQTMQLNSAEEWTILNQADDKAHPFHIHVNPFQITEVFEPNAPWLDEKDQPEKDGDGKLLPLYILSETDRKKRDQCLLDLEKPEPWKPCTPIPAPYVWWDTFAIPTTSDRNLTELCKGNKAQCPQAIQPYVTCTTTRGTTTGTTTTGGTTTGGTIKDGTLTGGTLTGGTTTGGKDSLTTGGTTTCTATIPGHFKMRSRFVDFTGTYVVHCHILIHEDRGMMQLVRVCPTKDKDSCSESDKPAYAHH